MINGRRLQLDSESSRFLDSMTGELRSLHCKMSRSELASEIVKIFFEKYFTRDSKRLEKLFFDERGFLTKILQSANTEEVETSLRKILKMKSNKK